MKTPLVPILIVLLLALTLLEWLVWPHYSPRFAWHDWPGYMAYIGLGAALVIGYATKAWLAPLLQVKPAPESEEDDG